MIHCLEELQSDRESFDSEQDFKMHLKSFDSDWYFGAWILNHFKSAEAGSLNFKLAQLYLFFLQCSNHVFFCIFTVLLQTPWLNYG